MSSPARFAFCAGLVVTGYVMAVVSASHIMYRAGYLQAQRDFPVRQRCNDLIR